jgi:tRNA-splicing ligase RtcB
MKKRLKPEEVIEALNQKGITIRVGSVNNIAEEAPESYKDVMEVVDICITFHQQF